MRKVFSCSHVNRVNDAPPSPVRQLTTVSSHEGIRGYNRSANNSSVFGHDCKSTGGGTRPADAANAGITAALGSHRPSSRRGSERDNDEAVMPRPETSSASGESSTASESGGGDEDDRAEEGRSWDSAKIETGREMAGAVEQMRVAENSVPGGSAESIPPQVDCLRGR